MRDPSFLELTINAHWRVGVIVGIVGWFLINVVVPPILRASGNHYFVAIGENFESGGANWLGYSFLAVCWIGALTSFVVKRVSSRSVPPRVAGAQRPNSTSNPPACPKCGSEMVLRTARADGRRFWGCSAFPGCRGTRAAN